MKKTVLTLALIALVASGGPASAVIGTIDQVPAATLLLPYFEVNLTDPNGITTLFSVNNASATAVLVHLEIWTDLSVPILDFNIYLTGYDVQTINLRDILVNGTLPQTASAGQDPHDTISPKGQFSQDRNFASCNGALPVPTLPALYINHLQAALTGQLSTLLGGCAGLAYGDNIARGYITMDTVSNCTLRFPGDIGYFASGGTGEATNQNVLWGDYFFVNPGQNYASGDTLVHIEAAPGVGVSTTMGTYGADPRTTTAGNYTFYGRYVSWAATDNREPLSTTFAARYVNGGGFSGGTDFVVWRDSKVPQLSFKCGTIPAWYPLGQEGIVIFDEQEHPSVPQSFPVSPQPPQQGIIPFPAEAQRTQVGGVAFPVPFDFGWIFVDLNTTVVQAGSNPPIDPRAAQAWVSVVMSAEGRYSVGYDAEQLDSAAAVCPAAAGCSSGVNHLVPGTSG